MNNQDLAQVLTEISQIITPSRVFVRDPDELEGGHYEIDLEALKHNIDRRVIELTYDEWAE